MDLQKLHLIYRLRLVVNEAFSHRKKLIFLFLVVNFAMLFLGSVWPKGYVSSTTIHVDEKKIIEPLMEGAAVATGVADRARIARDVIFGRKIMNQILDYAGWMKSNPSPEEQEKIIEKIIHQTTITSSGKDVINIKYRDDNPERAFKTTQKFAELFISESLAAKSAESRAAFDFIDNQTEQYHQKLVKAEEQLKEFRSANIEAIPGSDADISARLSTLRAKIDTTTQDLKEAEVKANSLEKQLSGEAEIATVLSREGQYRARIAELHSRLETLRLSYHDTYPDIIQINNQIHDLEEAIAEDRRQREAAKEAGKVKIDENVINNPMYQGLRSELSKTQVIIDTLNARIAETKRELREELDRGKRVHGGEATLAELTRDYTVNRDIYQDLLKRRENARVSMNMDMDKQGLNIKILEPATLPLAPTGLRFIHFVIGGLVLSFIIPFGVIYGLLYIDPRIRIGRDISEKRKLPLMTVPHLWSAADTRSIKHEVAWLSLVINVTLLTVVAVSYLRFIKVI
jgi:protein tyrosine kinase modulator